MIPKWNLNYINWYKFYALLIVMSAVEKNNENHDKLTWNLKNYISAKQLKINI